MVQSTKLFKYADDSALLKVIKEIIVRAEAVGEMDQDLRVIVDWAEENLRSALHKEKACWNERANHGREEDRVCF